MRNLKLSELKSISGGCFELQLLGLATAAALGTTFLALSPLLFMTPGNSTAAAKNVTKLIANFNDVMGNLSITQQGIINSYIDHREGVANFAGYLEGLRHF